MAWGLRPLAGHAGDPAAHRLWTPLRRTAWDDSRCPCQPGSTGERPQTGGPRRGELGPDTFSGGLQGENYFSNKTEPSSALFPVLPSAPTAGRHRRATRLVPRRARGGGARTCQLALRSSLPKRKKKKKKPLSFKHVFDEELKIINFIKSTLENTSV